MDRPSVFEAAGGGHAFLALAAAHHQRCLDDPVLNHPFSHGGHPDHIPRLAGYWGEVFGGPPAYTQVSDGHSGMLELHSGQGMEDDLGERFLACFIAAADDAGLPQDPELRATLAAYMRWAVDDVMSYDPPDSVVAPGLPMPQWSWDGLQPRS